MGKIIEWKDLTEQHEASGLTIDELARINLNGIDSIRVERINRDAWFVTALDREGHFVFESCTQTLPVLMIALTTNPTTPVELVSDKDYLRKF